ncbi:MAG: hypothetical protein JNK02_09415, partial [Planctomycetes bacterium]|nr:hypothetical protein [Planctomycetota bacterium]
TTGSGGNSVVPIDPYSHTVGTPVFVGSQPSRIAISDNGQYLYAALEGSNAVQRVHVPTQTADLTIPLGSDPFFGPLYAEDLAVQPGNPTVIAVSRKRLGVSPRHGGVAVFEGAVQRPLTTPDHTGSNVIEWTDAADTVVGYNNETTDFRVRTIQVSAQGAANVQALATAISGFGVDIEYAQGALYATTGAAVNPLTGLTLGTYPGVGSAARVAVNPGLDRVYYISGNTLRTYVRSTFALLDTLTIAGVQGTPRNLVRWGNESLAFSTTQGQVFVLTGDETRVASRWNECVATPNSSGVPAALSITGSLSVAAGEAALRVAGLPFPTRGQFLMGRNSSFLPFGNGHLCIDMFSGIHRVPGLASSDAGGNAAMPIPFAQLATQYGFRPGTTYRFQFWFRDAVGAGFNLSDVAAASFCP